MLTNLIQSDASGPATKSALPFPSAGPGSSSFASTLQSAQVPAPATPQLEPAAVAGRGKPAEKRTTDNLKTTAAGQMTTAAGPAPIADAQSPSVVAVNLAIVPPLPQNIGGSIATVGSIPSPVNSRSDAAIASITGANSKQATSIGIAREFQPDALTHNAGTIVGSASSLGALATDKLTPTGDLASPPNVAAATVEPIIPLPVGEVSPPPAPGNESGPGQHSLAQTGAVAPSVTNRQSAGMSTSDSAVPDPTSIPTNAVSAVKQSTSDDKRQAGSYDPRLGLTTATQSAMLLAAMDPASSPMNAATGVEPSASQGKLQAGDRSFRSGITTPTPSVMPLGVMDATSSPNAVTEVKQVTLDGKSQTGNGDLRPVIANSTQNLMPSQAINATSGAAIATAADPSAPDSKPQSGGSSPGGSAAQSASLAVSSTASLQEISKPVPLPAPMAMKAGEEIPTAPAPSKPVPSNQEHSASKAGDPSSTSTGTNTPPLSPSAPPAASTGQVNGGNQPGSAVASASVLTQVMPAANQDSGSRNASSPAAELQSSAAGLPNPLPTVGTVESARLVAGVAQSEMHVELHTQAFGNVEVHTVVRDSQVGLTVGSERGDLRTLLAPEVAGLQTTFRQQDLRFDSIHFLGTAAGTTAGFSGGGDSQPRSSSQQHSSPAGLFSIHGPPEDPTEPDISSGLRTRLNVHA